MEKVTISEKEFIKLMEETVKEEMELVNGIVGDHASTMSNTLATLQQATALGVLARMHGKLFDEDKEDS